MRTMYCRASSVRWEDAAHSAGRPTECLDARSFSRVGSRNSFESIQARRSFPGYCQGAWRTLCLQGRWLLFWECELFAVWCSDLMVAHVGWSLDDGRLLVDSAMLLVLLLPLSVIFGIWSRCAVPYWLVFTCPWSPSFRRVEPVWLFIEDLLSDICKARRSTARVLGGRTASG